MLRRNCSSSKQRKNIFILDTRPVPRLYNLLLFLLLACLENEESWEFTSNIISCLWHLLLMFNQLLFDASLLIIYEKQNHTFTHAHTLTCEQKRIQPIFVEKRIQIKDDQKLNSGPKARGFRVKPPKGLQIWILHKWVYAIYCKKCAVVRRTLLRFRGLHPWPLTRGNISEPHSGLAKRPLCGSNFFEAKSW